VSALDDGTRSAQRWPLFARRVTFREDNGIRGRVAVRTGTSGRPSSPYDRQQQQQATQRGPMRGRFGSATTNNNCDRCGGMHVFGTRYCRAVGVQCFNCSGMNYLARQCRRGRRPFLGENQA